MSGGWEGSDRSSRLPPDWRQRTSFVHRRSGWRCEFLVTVPGRPPYRCPRPADGGVDHIRRGDDHSYANLRDSCHQHHSKKSSLEGREAEARYRALARRPPEPHPGQIRRRSS